MKQLILLLIILNGLGQACKPPPQASYRLSQERLQDKIKGAWAVQTIGVTFGGPTEFRYLQRPIPDSVSIRWSDTLMQHWMQYVPGLYDDIYMDLTFVEVLEQKGLDATAADFGRAYAQADFWLWHANQQGRYNLLNGLVPPASGHWLNNPHADDIDFQIEADFIGIMTPGMPRSVLDLCDRVGHVMNAGDGYYGGVFVAGMYSQAFVQDSIPEIVQAALELIPAASSFYQCIADVIAWYQEQPNDWRQTWQKLESKWGLDQGCPDGAGQAFNIDAKLNAAYVVIGLLYGKNDLGQTLEIATRCGQDSDCNPATAGGIWGTVHGYSQIPEKWAAGLALIENMDFRHTRLSLNEAYVISHRHAQEMIRRQGGRVGEHEVLIPQQTTPVAPLEQNFPQYHLQERRKLNKRFSHAQSQQLRLRFEGVGVVLSGKVGNLDFEEKYALIDETETLDRYVLQAEFYLDNKLAKTMSLPLYFVERAHELFFQYELPMGPHQLRMEILNPHPKVYLDIEELLVYHK